ncbi:hypothetical protein IFR04_006143 [Cadophora malorum]|uniref:Uncharacterized protein n=1 Tax=Cadophora malorum TaxID=108018 RepID=A0A8H7TJK9_9HELO|nr:hypothetical protein IFR04_006143 [Cadophora malorum]
MPQVQPTNLPCQKTQPWKAHWPPASKAASGVEYGIEKGEVVVVDGTSARVSPPSRLAEEVSDGSGQMDGKGKEDAMAE